MKIQDAEIKVGAKAGEKDKIFGSANGIQVTVQSKLQVLRLIKGWLEKALGVGYSSNTPKLKANSSRNCSR